MMLFVTTFDQQATVREFSCSLGSIEANFDFLSSVVAQGHVLLTAHMLEDMNCTLLPLAAFDGLPLSIGIRALQDEWRAILSEPRSSLSIHQEEIIHLTRQRIHYYEVNIRTHKRMIDWYNQWLQRTQDGHTLSLRKSRLVNQYATHLMSCQAQLAKAQFCSELATNRLTQLLA